jgi:hypothetical protein
MNAELNRTVINARIDIAITRPSLTSGAITS